MGNYIFDDVGERIFGPALDRHDPGHRQAICPGKVTLTARLFRAASRGEQTANSNTSAQAETRPTQLKPMDASRSHDTSKSSDWNRVVFRPDLYSEPASGVAPSPLQLKKQAETSEPIAPQPPSPSGVALPHDVRVHMESALDADFSLVRIHEGPQAESLGAVAYTQGTDIHFQPGRYDPYSQQGMELLGHELTHVVQQAQGRVHATTQAKGMAINRDSSLEKEADDMGARVACSGRTPVLQVGGSRPIARPTSSSIGQPVQRWGICEAPPAQQDSDDGLQCVDPQSAYESALQGLYSQGDEFEPTCSAFQDYCSALDQMSHSEAGPPSEPMGLALPADHVIAIDEAGELVMLPIPAEFYQVDEALTSALDEVAQIGLGGESVVTLPVGEVGQVLLWDDGRAVSVPPMSAGFWQLMAQGTPFSVTDGGMISSPGFSSRPWQRARDSGLHGLFGAGVYQLGTSPISRFNGVSLPAGSRIRFADPRFPIRAQTRVMSIFVPGTKKYYAWDLHSLPVGSSNPPVWHINQKGMSAGLFGQSNHSPMTPAQIQQGRTLRYMKIGGRVFLIVGVAVDSWNLGSSIGESIEQGTPEPAIAETIRVVGGWGGAWAGMKLGCLTGGAAGIETGPGAAVTCALGGLIGGVAGYFGADWIADLIHED